MTKQGGPVEGWTTRVQMGGPAERRLAGSCIAEWGREGLQGQPQADRGDMHGRPSRAFPPPPP